jgi:Ca2+-binding EF-hand superfamily protein
MRITFILAAAVAWFHLLGISVRAEDAEDAESKSQDTEEDGKTQEEDNRVFSDDELKDVFSEVDANGNNELARDELAEFVGKHRRKVLMDEIDDETEEALRKRDKSGDGTISLEEHLDASMLRRERYRDRGLEERLEAEEDIELEEHLEAEVCDEKDIENYKEWNTDVFHAADTNGDGVISKDELPSLLHPKMGAEFSEKMLEVNMKHAMKMTDTNGDGQLSLDEFTANSKDFLETNEGDSATEDEVKQQMEEDGIQMEKARSKIESRKMFKRLDANSDGVLDQEELRPWASGQLARDDIAGNLISELDKDGDQQIDSDELIQGKSTLRDSQIQDYLIAWAKGRQIISGPKSR